MWKQIERLNKDCIHISQWVLTGNEEIISIIGIYAPEDCKLEIDSNNSGNGSTEE